MELHKLLGSSDQSDSVGPVRSGMEWARSPRSGLCWARGVRGVAKTRCLETCLVLRAPGLPEKVV